MRVVSTKGGMGEANPGLCAGRRGSRVGAAVEVGAGGGGGGGGVGAGFGARGGGGRGDALRTPLRPSAGVVGAPPTNPSISVSGSSPSISLLTSTLTGNTRALHSVGP